MENPTMCCYPQTVSDPFYNKTVAHINSELHLYIYIFYISWWSLVFWKLSVSIHFEKNKSRCNVQLAMHLVLKPSYYATTQYSQKQSACTF